ncbi:LytTR family DNA-binding domain-containing protein [Furfurilactobacillus siliginis]|uniref:Transcriptional regulator n=1 Tax=Furfurilactobacillus siliginis TaxID=348151 RepID=A0A0R2L4V5_9LACO|nr:LytTR family DNA-binding domain-containing protein [Furfurilactobacillus siliginis]KRN96416.1 hypothetical protein IV55_GL001385 [Furfurilactobacillus siliginis]GEK29202.1 transcriptional regulator [Furfurilactobacillus siliginis]
MKIRFESESSIDTDVIEVTVRANEYDQKVHAVMDYLNDFSSHTPQAVLTASDGDRITVIHDAEVVALEVQGEVLMIVTTTATYTSRQRLYKVLAQLNHAKFVQISRGVAINMDYLASLESGFSGNMTAIMTTGVKENVSRKYLGAVKEYLGL